jgi:transcriptional regulator with XRE-family HTH domain
METIGRQIRYRRKQKGLTLKQVAEKADCSDVFISQVERNLASPSIATLKRIANALGVNLITLIQPDETEEEHVVTRKKDRVQFKFPHTEVYSELLATNIRDKQMQPLYKIVKPGAGSEGTYRHEGEEMGIVLEGTLELTVDTRVYDLEPGDAFYFRSSRKHGYRNKGKEETRMIWVITPPTF